MVFRKQDGWRGVQRLARELGGERFDLTLNLNVYFKSLWPTVLSRGRLRLGFERGRAKDLTWLAANRHLPPRPRRHTQDMFLEFPAALGIPSPPFDYRLQITPAERAAQQAFRERVGGRYVALVAASANRNKDWLPEPMARVADAVHEEFGLRAVLAGGPGARETALAREIESLAQHKPAWGLGDGVRRLLWLIGGAEVLVAPDTGPVHMARALEVPVIGLYGHTNPWRVGPYRWCEDLWIDRYTDGEPDPSNFTPKGGRMAQITAEDVIERLRRALAGAHA